MLADAVAWVCRTPRRLAVFAVTVMAVVLIGSNLLGDHGSSAPAGGARSPSPVVTAAQVPDPGPFVAAAVRFVQAWSQLPPGSTVAQWQQKLVPLTTADLGKELRTTDPGDLPGSAPRGEPVVRYVAQASALIAVPLADGTSVLVTVVSDTSGQRVSDVQPFAGDN